MAILVPSLQALRESRWLDRVEEFRRCMYSTCCGSFPHTDLPRDHSLKKSCSGQRSCPSTCWRMKHRVGLCLLPRCTLALRMSTTSTSSDSRIRIRQLWPHWCARLFSSATPRSSDGMRPLCFCAPAPCLPWSWCIVSATGVDCRASGAALRPVTLWGLPSDVTKKTTTPRRDLLVLGGQLPIIRYWLLEPLASIKRCGL